MLMEDVDQLLWFVLIVQKLFTETITNNISAVLAKNKNIGVNSLNRKISLLIKLTPKKNNIPLNKKLNKKNKLHRIKALLLKTIGKDGKIR